MHRLTGSSADAMIEEILLAHFTKAELMGLGHPAIRTIRRQLARADLDQAEHVEAVFQDALFNIHVKCQNDRNSIDCIRSYFIAVCANAARRYRHNIIRTQRVEVPWSEAIEGLIRLPEEPLVDEQTLFSAALSNLSPRKRRIIELKFVDLCSPREIQVALGLTDSALRPAIHRAQLALRKALRDQLDQR